MKRVKLSQLSKTQQAKIRRSWSKAKKAHIETSKFVMNTAWKYAKEYGKKLNENPYVFFIWALREVWKNISQPKLF